MAKQANTEDLQNAIKSNGNTKAAPQVQKREAAFKTLQNHFARSASELKKVLPANITPQRIERVTLTAARKNPVLLDCDQRSLLGAVFQAAQLGLQPDLLGSCYLVPFNDRQSGTKQVQLIIGYKGYIDLIYRSQRIISIEAEVVRQNDIFHARKGSDPVLNHEQADDPSEEVRGYYAIARLNNGGVLWHYMSKAQVESYRDKNTKGGNVWAQHFDSMAKKTVLRQLTNWLPISIEQKEFAAIDETVTADIGEDPEYIDADFTVEEGS